MRRTGSVATRLTLTDPWGECDLLWRNPTMKGFPLLDTAVDGWYGFRPVDRARLNGSDARGSIRRAAGTSRLLLFYGLRSLAPASDLGARFSLSGVLVKPARGGAWKGTQRVTINLSKKGAHDPKPYLASPEGSGYGPKTKAQPGFRTLGLVAGEVDGARADIYSAEPLFVAFQLEGMGFPCGGYRAVITEPAS
jgi:hypothetical protein